MPVSLLLAAPLLLTASSAAFAHAHLRTASPAAGSSVTESPTEVVIAYTEDVEPKFSTIEVTDSAGQRLDSGVPHIVGDASHLGVGLKRLPPGVYTVVWHATAVDTHKTEGTYKFTVAAAAETGITVDKVWARPSAGAAKTSAAYFTVSDAGKPDRLTGVSTPAAAMAELHETINDNGIMKMRGVPGIALEPGKPVIFAPGGYHVMLMGLKQPLKVGDTFPLTLTFEHSAPVTVNVPVQTGIGGGMMHDMPMAPHS
jgi:copper(I)-binding protein